MKVQLANPTQVIGGTETAPPFLGSTQTFISCGAFKTAEESENCQKYLKTKFARALLSIKKVTQHNPPDTWAYVPQQDFTNNSDIDWSKPISDIDNQLMDKYGLAISERLAIKAFISYEGDSTRVKKTGKKSAPMTAEEAQHLEQEHDVKFVRLEDIVRKLKCFWLLADMMRLAQFTDCEKYAQKFLENSNVDLLLAPAEVDRQFYKAYGFTSAMIEFTEKRYGDVR